MVLPLPPRAGWNTSVLSVMFFPQAWFFESEPMPSPGSIIHLISVCGVRITVCSGNQLQLPRIYLQSDSFSLFNWPLPPSPPLFNWPLFPPPPPLPPLPTGVFGILVCSFLDLQNKVSNSHGLHLQSLWESSVQIYGTPSTGDKVHNVIVFPLITDCHCTWRQNGFSPGSLFYGPALISRV